MESFKRWLSHEDNRQDIPGDQIPFIINELDTNSVAIKGNNVFPVTYGLVANVSR